MNKNEQLYKRVKYLYYDQDLTEKEIAETLGKSRSWINAILNSDKEHKELLKRKRQNRVIKRNIEFYKNSSCKIPIPISMLEAIGINQEIRSVNIKVVKNRIVIEKSNI